MQNFQKDFLDLPSNSDKLEYHGYHRIYPWFLAHFRNMPVNLLEIGIHRTESLKIWKNYFSDIHVYGIDIADKEFEGEKVSIFKVDQSSAEQLDQFAEKVLAEFTIIVDDGSHVPEHQILTLTKLWKKLIPGGVYIIEDIETSYWGKSKIYGYFFNSNRFSAIQKILDGVHNVNWEFAGKNLRKKLQNQELHSILKQIEIISFAYNSIILVKKDESSFNNFYRDNYKRISKINNNSKRKMLISKMHSLFIKLGIKNK